MNDYIGPKLRLSRRLGVAIAETPKHVDIVERGEQRRWGRFRRRQKSLYGRQLDEKQKLAFYYNIGNRQLRRYLKAAQKSKGSTADMLMQLIERRLDNVVRRLGWARTIWQSRQLVVHGHVQVNGKKVDRPGYLVNPNEVIVPREKSRELLKTCAASAEGRQIPGWMANDEGKQEGQIIRLPTFEDIQLPFDLDCSVIVEFFSK